MVTTNQPAYLSSKTVYTWFFQDIFYVDQSTLVVRIPDLSSMEYLHESTSVIFQVSINSGVSWTSEITNAIYQFKPTPAINYLSHYGANLRAYFTLSVYGKDFTESIS